MNNLLQRPPQHKRTAIARRPALLALILGLLGLSGPLPAVGQRGPDAAPAAVTEASPREVLDQLRKDARADPPRTAPRLASVHT